MHRYLVIANQTIESPLLLEAIEERRRVGPSDFHLIVPEDHLQGSTWDEGHARVAAKIRLAEGISYLAAHGIPLAGEVATLKWPSASSSPR